MNTVTMYKVTCTKAYQMSEQGSGYSLRPWGSNTADYEGHDDGGRLYALPEGYTLAESQGDPDELFDEKGRPCVIVMHSSGLPELVSLNRSVVLRRQDETKNRGGTMRTATEILKAILDDARGDVKVAREALEDGAYLFDAGYTDADTEAVEQVHGLLGAVERAEAAAEAEELRAEAAVAARLVKINL